jgi:type I restriction enzyme S subunit
VTTIGEIGQVFDGPHATPKTIDKGPIFLGIPSLNAGRLDLSNTRHVSEEDFVKWTKRVEPKAGDIVFSYETKIGEAAVIPKGLRCCLGRRMGLVRLNPEICDSRFFLYQYLSPNYQKFLASMTVHGATVDRLLLKDFPSFNFPLPPIDEQREIASILGALDDKIELNRRMSATLEDMARSLYRSWFVDFDPVHAKMEGRQPAFMDEATAALFPDRFGDDGLPEGWEMSSIYQVARVQYGAPFKSKAFNTDKNGRPLVRIRDLKNHQAGVYTTEVHPKEYLIQPGDTVVGMDGDFTPYTWCAEPSLMNQRVCCFVALNERDHAFVRLAIPSLLKAEEDAAVATTVIHLGKKDIDTFKVVSPPPSILQAFGQRANPFLSKMVAAGIEAKTLASLRDSLLPKLMSGEIRVGEAREQIEEVA